MEWGEFLPKDGEEADGSTSTTSPSTASRDTANAEFRVEWRAAMNISEIGSSNRWLTGETVRQAVRESPSARLEIYRRHAEGRVDWTFCQPALALFWFGREIRRSQLVIDGEHVETTYSSRANLALVVSESSIQGGFETDEYFNYAVAFFDLSRVEVQPSFARSEMAFANSSVQEGLSELVRGAGREDALFSLLLEGWSLQTLARLNGVHDAANDRRTDEQGSLPAASLRLVTEFVCKRYGSPLTVADLARVAGYSVRHFTRAFRATTGRTPMEFVMATRIEMAERLIAAGRRSMTDVALACGFSQAQHFSVVFRRVAGMSPTQFASSGCEPRTYTALPRDLDVFV
jgi:AraC family transcriptional regulator